MLSLKKVLIFDMDGTLIDSSGVISGAINYVRSKLNLPPMPKDELLKAVNDMHIHSPSHFYEVDEFSKDHTDWFLEYYSNNYDSEVKLYDGVRELLEELKNYYKLSLATNAYSISTKEIITHLDIDRYFDIVVSANEVERSKPYPDMVIKILDHFNVKPNEALMIGDSLKDKEAASRAGVDTLLVDWGFSDLYGALNDIKELKSYLLTP